MVARITVLDTHNLVTIKDIPECWLYEPAVSREWTKEVGRISKVRGLYTVMASL